jgi:hypothetical protein
MLINHQISPKRQVWAEFFSIFDNIGNYEGNPVTFAP